MGSSDLSPPPSSPRPTPVAVLKLFTALLAISCAPIFIRFSETGLGPNGTVLNRLFIFMIVFGTTQVVRQRFWPATDHPEDQSPITFMQWGLLLGVGGISVCSLGLWATSLVYISVAKSMLLNNLTPLFTTLGSWLVFRKQFDTRFLIGMGIALVGAIALGSEDLSELNTNLWGDFCALLSAVFLATYLMMLEQLRSRFSATTILLSRSIGASLLLFPITWFTEGQLFPNTASVWLAVIALAVICEGLGQRFLADSMSQFSSSFIALFLLLEPIISTILAWFAFGEQPSPLTWVGFVVVLSGIYIAIASPSVEKTSIPVSTQ